MQLGNLESYIKAEIGINRTLAEESSMTSTWYAWYKGFDDKFHKYQVYNDGQYLDMEKLKESFPEEGFSEEDLQNYLENKLTDENKKAIIQGKPWKPNKN